MFPKWEYYDPKIQKTTTSSSLSYRGRPVRIDFQKRLETIADTLKIQSSFYPKFKGKHLKIFIEKAIGFHDPRTMQNYFDFIVNHSEKDIVNGLYDVSGFCDLFVKIT